jgi:hypothetical protein
MNNKWISVNDAMPKETKDYLVTDGACCMVAEYRIDGNYWFFFGLQFWDNDHVTHWMELPALTITNDQ